MIVFPKAGVVHLLLASRRAFAALLVGAVVSATAHAQAANAAPVQQTPPAPPAMPPAAGPPASRPVGDPLDRLVTLELDRISVAEALRQLEAQASLGLAYTSETLPTDRVVTLSVRRARAGEALDRILAGTGVTFKRSTTGQLLLVRMAPRVESALPPDTLPVTMVMGFVTDTANVPLADVVVTVRGTKLSALTNAQGAYLIAGIPPGPQVVMVRRIGYKPAQQEVLLLPGEQVRDKPFGTVNSANFVLSAKVVALEELVNTASGPRRRIELGNDIVILNADSIVANEPIGTVTDLLDGRVPGLEVQRSSGAPGDPSRIRLRGGSSVFLNNDPIVYVDGVRFYAATSDSRNRNLASNGFASPSPLDYLDPHSIQTIEVMKGPSAASLYGSDAANGVIVITTKKGQAGPAQWNFSASRGVTQLPGEYPRSYLRFGHLAGSNTAIPCPLVRGDCVADSLVAFQPLNDPRLTILGTGDRTDASAGVSGGSEALQYAVAGNYGNETGYIRLPGLEASRYRATHGRDVPGWMERPQQLSHWGVNTRLTAKLGKTADVSVTGVLSRTDQQRSSLEGQLVNLMSTYVDRGTGLYYRYSPFGDRLDQVNDLFTAYYDRVRSSATQFTNGVSLNWRPREWFSANAEGGVNTTQRSDDGLLRRGDSPGSDSIGAASSGRGTATIGTMNLRATALASLPHAFRLQTTVGTNYTNSRTSDVSISGSNLALGGTSIGSAGTLNSSTERTVEQATFGWYIEPTLSRKRIWISTGLRLDGGNGFGTNSQLALFPKVSVSYLISDESFFPWKSLFSSLRLRGAFGHAGVQPSPEDRLRLYARQGGLWVENGTADAVTLQTIGNTHLRPERSIELEGGFDADLLDDRFSIAVSLYRQRRVDALMPVPLPPSVYGEISMLQNIGEVRNTGVEVQFGSQWIRSPAVRFGTALGFSRNRNSLTKLGRGIEPFYSGGTSRVAEGYPLNGRWAKPVLGYNDVDANGILSSSEIIYGDTAVYLGSQDPDFTLNLQTSLSLFNGTVNLSTNWSYEHGITQLGPWSSMRQILRGYQDPNASLAEQAAVQSSATSDFLAMQTVNTLRWSSVSVGYVLPARIARAVRAKALTLSLQGTNLWHGSNYRGKDPGVNSSGPGNGLEDSGVLPIPRMFQLRVNANY